MLNEIKDDDLQLILDALMSNIPQALFWKDKNLVFRGCNQIFAEQFGYKTPSEIIGRTDYEFPFEPELIEKYHKDDYEIINHRRPKMNYEERQRQPDGSVKTVLVSKFPICNQSDEVVFVMGLYTDITHLKQLEQVRKINTLNKEKKIQALKSLAGSIAHELRTPITTISLCASELKYCIEDLASAYDQLIEASPSLAVDLVDLASLKEIPEEIAFLTNSCHQIINLQLSNIKAEHLNNANVTQCSARAVVSEAIDSYPLTHKERALFNHEQLGLIEDFIFSADPVYVKHVIWNLLQNAVYHVIAAGKPDADNQVAIWTEKKPEYNVIHIKDNGVGMTDEVKKNIFKQFFTQRRNGTGLGLFFCKTVMERLGGKITCTSKLGEFTQFSLWFPEL